MTRAYGPDLAFIHDTGFAGFAQRAAPGLLAILRRNGVARGLVVDLGCGSGVLAAALAHAGYDIFGIDQSAAMIALARQRVPPPSSSRRPPSWSRRPSSSRAVFRRGSFAAAALPPCDAIAAVGECLNYDLGAGSLRPRTLFARARRALRPGGVLVFDALLPRQGPAVTRTFGEGKGWAVLVESARAGSVLTRRIVAYRRIGGGYRRSEEIHRLRLYPATQLASWLRREGFRVRIMEGYGRFRLADGGRAVFVARRA